MARELLAIPGTAVPSERVNSEAREMLPYTRNRLGPEKIEATLVVSVTCEKSVQA
jgi:hAT family C-terminal dimerisation region